jgi:nucleoside-diphosphate kinase
MTSTQQHYKHEQTLVIVKPDGIQRSLVGEVIKRYERIGLKLVGLKMLVASNDLLLKHYELLGDDWKKGAGTRRIEALRESGLPVDSEDPLVHGQRLFDRLITYMSIGPVIAMVWQGAHAVDIVRKVTGGTEPRTSNIGTIRGDFMLDSYPMSNSDDRAIRNIVHASGSIEEANREIGLWFTKDELIAYRLVQEEILYDVNLDGILE